MNTLMKVVLIIAISSSVIYLGIAYGLVLLMPLKGAEGRSESLQFSDIDADYTRLPTLSQYETRNHTRLPYRHYPSSANQVLIMIHGSSYHSSYLQPLASFAAQSGLATVYTPDLRGHGPLAEDRGDLDYMGQIEDDLYDFIDYVQAKHPNQSIILGGHSSGGGTVLRLAGGERAHAAVDRYLLIAPYIHHNAPTYNENSNWANVSVPRFVGLSMLNQLGIRHLNGQAVLSFNMPEPYRNGTETLIYSYRMQVSMHPRDDYQADIRSLNGPVLVIAGGEDEAFLADQYERVFEINPLVEVSIVDGLSHFHPIHDERALKVIGDWLGG
ncbi:alpha/beta hydrolase [Paenibacillus sp. YYML68]|uniref:alpha/beta hydrolase n=1 Tax=Paenibacillus sp. YYML68 TaxID=2909250 RepID=UPI002492FCA7|nr:alpha/beta fold hydrolase [Paenibacillus sp. YYML68]